MIAQMVRRQMSVFADYKNHLVILETHLWKELDWNCFGWKEGKRCVSDGVDYITLRLHPDPTNVFFIRSEQMFHGTKDYTTSAFFPTCVALHGHVKYQKSCWMDWINMTLGNEPFIKHQPTTLMSLNFCDIVEIKKSGWNRCHLTPFRREDRCVYVRI